MTPRERTLAVLARQRPDRLPRELKLTPPLAEVFQARTGASDPAEYFQLEVRDVFFAPPTEFADFSPYYPDGMPRLWNPPGWEVGEWGVGVTSGSMHHFIHIEHPLKRLAKLEDLERYPFPDLYAPRGTPTWRPRSAGCTTAGCSRSASWNGRSLRSPGTCAAWRSCLRTSPSIRRWPNTCWIGLPRGAATRPGALPKPVSIC